MAKTVIENVNTIMVVKNELKDILKYLNMNPNDVFMNYPGQFSDLLDAMKTISDDIVGE